MSLVTYKAWAQVVRFMSYTINLKGSVLENITRTKNKTRDKDKN